MSLSASPTKSEKEICPSPHPILIKKVKEEPVEINMDTTEDIWKKIKKNELDSMSTTRRECPEVLKKEVEFKKRTYKDCPDCLQFESAYGKELSKEVLNKRFEKCSRHNRMDENINLTPEGFWDPFMSSLPEDDRRKEIFVDYRLVNNK